MNTELTEEFKQGCIDFAENPVTGNVIWKNTNSYSRYDKERLPTIFEAKIGDNRVIICGVHLYYPGQFILSCYALGFKEYILNETNPRKAAEKALVICIERVRGLYKAFSRI